MTSHKNRKEKPWKKPAENNLLSQSSRNRESKAKTKKNAHKKGDLEGQHLSLSRRLIQAHFNGRIKSEQTRKGEIFTVFSPLCKDKMLNEPLRKQNELNKNVCCGAPAPYTATFLNETYVH
jgi:hypothetical protein